MVAEKEGFVAFKSSNINMLLLLRHRLGNIRLHARSIRVMFIRILFKKRMGHNQTKRNFNTYNKSCYMWGNR